MTSKEILELISKQPVFYLATMDGDQPRVRGMMLYRADERGIVFHTASTKDVFKQIKANPKAEMCFPCGEVQVRVTGVLEQNDDPALREEIFAHPSRKFLHAWKEKGIDGLLQVFVLKDCSAVTWTMATNFDPKEPIKIC
jgi:uncharacterized pyridoxamine 5'-phosphate oxidase family protein